MEILGIVGLNGVDFSEIQRLKDPKTLLLPGRMKKSKGLDPRTMGGILGMWFNGLDFFFDEKGWKNEGTVAYWKDEEIRILH